MEKIHEIDLAFTSFIQNYLHSATLDKVFSFFTQLGDNGILWISIGLLMLIPKKSRKSGLMLLSALALAFISSELVLKNIVQRERPFITDPELLMIITPPSGYSFPSSHASSSFAAAISLILNYRTLGNIALIAAFLISFSRVYLYAHYLSDVMCGAILGISSAFIMCFIFYVVGQKKDKINNLDN